MARTVESAFDELINRQALTPSQEKTATDRGMRLGLYFTNNFTMAKTPFYIGSYARQTICASQRDVDSMAPFSVSTYWQRYKDDSRAFLYWVRDHLNDHYHSTEVSSRQVAVTLDFTVIAMDVVPCFQRTGGGYLMPNGKGGWMATNPPFHTEMIEASDRAKARRLRPLIRLLKAWNIANDHLLSSFHIELIVERMKRSHAVGQWPGEVAAVLKTLPSWTRNAFPDPWPDGQRVDQYLSDENRGKVLKMLGSDAQAAAEAEDLRQRGRIEEAFQKWNTVFRKTFPAYG